MRFPLAGLAIVMASTGDLRPLHAQERVLELWRGQIVLGDYDCARRASDGIVIDEPVRVIVEGDAAKLACDSLIFRPGGILRANGSLDISVDRLSGPVSIEVALDPVPPSTMPTESRARRSSRPASRAGLDAPAPPYLPLQRFPVQVRMGGAGTPGASGLPGATGRHGVTGPTGRKGPSVRLSLNQVDAGTSIHIVASGDAGGPGQDGQNGGQGGAGGRGGDGGIGSAGTFRFLPGSGGRGGNGGRGGRGGAGGNGGNGGQGGAGGDIDLVFSESSFDQAARIPLELLSVGGSGGDPGNGGTGGRGGSGGRGGRGGVGGSASEAMSGVPDGRPGRAGLHGWQGSHGANGRAGEIGRTGQIGAISWGSGASSIDDLLKELER